MRTYYAKIKMYHFFIFSYRSLFFLCHYITFVFLEVTQVAENQHLASLQFRILAFNEKPRGNESSRLHF